MSNEAAERLRALLPRIDGGLSDRLLMDALAAERRATVERIRERLARLRWMPGLAGSRAFASWACSIGDVEEALAAEDAPMTANALPRNLKELRERDEYIRQQERRATVERIRETLLNDEVLRSNLLVRDRIALRLDEEAAR